MQFIISFTKSHSLSLTHSNCVYVKDAVVYLKKFYIAGAHSTRICVCFNKIL